MANAARKISTVVVRGPQRLGFSSFSIANITNLAVPNSWTRYTIRIHSRQNGTTNRNLWGGQASQRCADEHETSDSPITAVAWPKRGDRAVRRSRRLRSERSGTYIAGGSDRDRSAPSCA